MKLALLLLLAVTTACKEKVKEPAKAPARVEPTTSGAVEPPPAPPRPTLPAQPPIDAAEPVDAPPTVDELALAQRAEYFGQVNKAVKVAGANCAELGRELEALGREGMAIGRLRSQILDETLLARDAAIVKTMMRQLLAASRTCGLPSVEPLVRTIGDLPTWDALKAAAPPPAK